MDNQNLPLFNREQLSWIAESMLFFMSKGFENFEDFTEAHAQAQEIYNIATGRWENDGIIRGRLSSKRTPRYSSKLDSYVLLGIEEYLKKHGKLPSENKPRKKKIGGSFPSNGYVEDSGKRA